MNSDNTNTGRTTNQDLLTRRTSQSLASRLNVQMTCRLFAVIASINILLLVFGLIIITWTAEKSVSAGVRYLADNSEGRIFESIALKDFDITQTDRQLDGYVFHASIQKRLARDGREELRMIGLLPDQTDAMAEGSQIWQLKYSLISEIDNISYRLTYNIGGQLRRLAILFAGLTVIELLLIVSESIKSKRIIKKTLEPIYELAQSARTLNEEVSNLGSQAEERQLQVLAGVLSGIDANRLDRQVSIDSEQDELKDLAAAINSMLSRINDAYKSQVQFVSDASHELRTPISVIQGYANLLDRWGKNDEKTMQESIDAIKAETQNMKELVEQLLFLARGDNETIQLHEESFDVCGLIEEIVREAEMIDSAHNFELRLEQPAMVTADKQLIKQAVRILVDNSCKYTPQGETITLKTSVDDNLVRLTVQDNGIGIEPEDLPHVFDRFYRSDISRTRKTGGSGLGLAIAKWIVERHGAHFEIISRVDIGTRITIVMPGESKKISGSI